MYKDATAFKIRELALNYTLPCKYSKQNTSSVKCTVGFIARNLFTLITCRKCFL